MLTPSRFERDPLGYAGNQCGHGVMGMMVAILILPTALPIWSIWLIAAFIYLLFVEVLPGQVARDPLDSLDDVTHTGLGAAFLVSAVLSLPGGVASGDLTVWAVAAAWGGFMGWQMWRRWRP
jgi:hypothetical protein